VVRRVARAGSLVALVTIASCAARGSPPAVAPAVVLVDTAGAAHPIRRGASPSTLTVISFFSAHCPCQAAHDARLRELHARFGAAGVAFLAVDSEIGATDGADEAERIARGYPFPIARDPGAALARSLGARYATYTVVLDGDGHVRYRGAIDSDRTHLTPGASFYLEDALVALLAGRSPRVTSSEALGCALQTW
jgi:hypothetical protein